MKNFKVIQKQEQKKEWEKEWPEELSFWDNWLKTKGDRWPEDFKLRCDPNSILQDIFLNYLNKNVSKNIILDVGAGPLTCINKKCHVSEVEIFPVDPLAGMYDDLLNKNNIKPIIRTEKCDGERLSDKFDKDTFDIVFSRNAIDHSYNPLKCIEEMIKVTKKKGFVILEIYEREGTHAGWVGLHSWDFFIKRNWFLFGKKSLFLEASDRREINISKELKDIGELVMLNSKDRMITSVFFKK